MASYRAPMQQPASMLFNIHPARALQLYQPIITTTYTNPLAIGNVSQICRSHLIWAVYDQAFQQVVGDLVPCPPDWHWPLDRAPQSPSAESNAVPSCGSPNDPDPANHPADGCGILRRGRNHRIQASQPDEVCR